MTQKGGISNWVSCRERYGGGRKVVGAAWPAQDPRREVSGKVTEDQTGKSVKTA